MLADELSIHHDLMLAPGARDAMLARLQQTVLVDPVPLSKTTRAPALLVWGKRDAMIPFANLADHLKAIPDVRLVPIPAAGHCRRKRPLPRR